MVLRQADTPGQGSPAPPGGWNVALGSFHTKERTQALLKGAGHPKGLQSRLQVHLSWSVPRPRGRGRGRCLRLAESEIPFLLAPWSLCLRVQVADSWKPPSPRARSMGRGQRPPGRGWEVTGDRACCPKPGRGQRGLLLQAPRENLSQACPPAAGGRQRALVSLSCGCRLPVSASVTSWPLRRPSLSFL